VTNDADRLHSQQLVAVSSLSDRRSDVDPHTTTMSVAVAAAAAKQI